MDTPRFWDLIATIDRAALADGDEETALAPLHEAMTELSIPEINGFSDRLAETLHALDGRAHAEHAGDNADSDDAFLYARCHVVAQGRARYEKVLVDPALMSSTSDEWCESLLYVASEAWAARMGRDPSGYDHVAPVSYETRANKQRWR